MKAKIN